MTTTTTTTNAALGAGQEFLYQATTRSIMGWKREVVFDPLTDVTRYAGARPFANFVAKHKFILYCHPELLDEETRRKLMYPNDDEDRRRRKDEKEKNEGSR